MKEVRRLVTDDFDQYYEVRLAGLIECPAAFTTDADAWRSASKETIERHLELSQDGQAPILGAWQGAELVGLIGMNPEQRASVSHKAGLWGFYVLPDHREQGIGGGLLTDMIGVAKTMPNLRKLRAVVPTSCGKALSLTSKLGFEQFGLEREARQVDGLFHDQSYLSYSLYDKG